MRQKELAERDDGGTLISAFAVANEFADRPSFLRHRRHPRLGFYGAISPTTRSPTGVTTAPPPPEPPVSALTAGSRSV